MNQIGALFLAISEGLKTGDSSAQDQGVDIVRAFVSVYRLQVHTVTNDVVLIADTVAAERIAANACNVQRFAAVIALDEGNHFGRGSETRPLVRDDQRTEVKKGSSTYWSASLRRPTWRQACRPRAISVHMSAYFF